MSEQKSYCEMSESEKKKEDWMNSKWRPMMGWMYMVVCTCDFVLFPILWSLVQAIHGGQVSSQWQPITLQGAGLFHIAMGAVLGLAAWGRTQEKMNGANNGGLPTTSGFGSAPAPSNFGGNTGGFNRPSAPSNFGGGFNKPAPTTSSFGKAMPAPQDDEPL